MYKNVTACIKCENGLTPKFCTKMGTRQGCNLSPTLFNIYVNDLIELLHKTCDLIDLGNVRLNSLMYADDLIVMARSGTGLQKCLNIIHYYCKKWKLDINSNKTKIIVFNKRPAFVTSNHHIGGCSIEVVRSYC